MKTSHLENILRMIERMSINGYTVRSGGGSCADDFWYDEVTYYGNDAKRELNYEHYKSELIKRGNHHELDKVNL